MKLGDYAEIVEGSAEGTIFEVIGIMGEFLLADGWNYRASYCKKWEPSADDKRLLWFWNTGDEYPIIGRFIKYDERQQRFIADVGYPYFPPAYEDPIMEMCYEWEFCEPFTRGIPDIKERTKKWSIEKENKN